MTDEAGRLARACLLPGFAGTIAPDWLRRELEAGLGGVVLFARNVADGAQLEALTRSLRAYRPEILVATDEEGGDVTRLEAATGSSYPGSLALGAVDDVALTERVAAAMAADLRAAGVNLDLAPVADVNTNPRNPVIGVRSFGADPALVSRHVAAFVTGLQAGGVAACVKHFPGHGDTEHDSHLELPVLRATRDEIDSSLAPFRAAIAAGVEAVMTAHLVVPALDERPATLSRAVLTTLLREELGFDGLVVTDALEMKAIASGVGMDEGAVQALVAGADAVCLGHDIDESHVTRVTDALVDALRQGRLPEGRLVEAAGRAGAVGRRAAAAPAGPVVDRSVGLDAARRALAVQGDVTLGRPPLLVELVPEAGIAAGEAHHGIGQTLGARLPSARTVRITAPAPGTTPPVPALDGRQLVLAVRDPGRHEWERVLAEELVRAAGDAIVVDVGLPDWAPAGARGRLVTHGAGRVSFEAAVERLLGP
jgi:beta-N-acetylhexosaminidase